jgi:hypothetical protein
VAKIYNRVEPEIAECYRCGRTEVLCSTYVAETREYETGYVDEYHLCEECDEQPRAVS